MSDDIYNKKNEKSPGFRKIKLSFEKMGRNTNTNNNSYIKTEINQFDNMHQNNIDILKEDSLVNLLDDYSKSFSGKKSNSDFQKKIDDLNLQFYLETEKMLKNNKFDRASQDNLFLILFKEISLYAEEVNRLNKLTSTIADIPHSIVNTQKEFATKDLLIQTLKVSKANIENKLILTLERENKLKTEIEELKEENLLLKTKLKKMKSVNSNFTHSTANTLSNNLHLNNSSKHFKSSSPESVNSVNVNFKKFANENNTTSNSINNFVSMKNMKKTTNYIKNAKDKLTTTSNNNEKNLTKNKNSTAASGKNAILKKEISFINKKTNSINSAKTLFDYDKTHLKTEINISDINDISSKPNSKQNYKATKNVINSIGKKTNNSSRSPIKNKTLYIKINEEN